MTFHHLIIVTNLNNDLLYVGFNFIIYTANLFLLKQYFKFRSYWRKSLLVNQQGMPLR